MSKITHLQTDFVEFIPNQLESGKIYISHKYSTAVHLCCCGCGHEVVTPLNNAKWSFIQSGNTVSLYPSIGNWSFPCQSHYWITRGKVVWASAMTFEEIEKVRVRDYLDIETYAVQNNIGHTLVQRVYAVLKDSVLRIQKWLNF